ncbi:hybrid signal transduction histidine kinase M [Tanacetum coccineum]
MRGAECLRPTLSFGVKWFLYGTTACTSTNATEWKKLDSLIGNLFHDNKEGEPWNSRRSHSTELGNLSIAEYFKKIKVTADLLANIDSAVEDKNLVIYAVNGLGDRYEHVASIIRHTKTPLTLLETRSMLLLEETLMNQKHRNGARDTTYSPTVLMTTSNNNTKNNNRQVCRNFQRGGCSFGERCRYLHVDSNGNRQSGNNTTRGSPQ